VFVELREGPLDGSTYQETKNVAQWKGVNVLMVNGDNPYRLDSDRSTPKVLRFRFEYQHVPRHGDNVRAITLQERK